MTSINIPQLISDIDSELKQVINSRDVPLYSMMSYHMGWTDAPGHIDTPLRKNHDLGVLCLLTCQSLGKAITAGIPAAAALELVENFTQKHDDIQSGNPSRDSRDAVWWIWGPAQAINAGDGMHALARLALFRLLENDVSPELVFEALKIMDNASLRTCEGRYMEMEAQERLDMPVETYVRMASHKEGSLISGALKIGALLGGVQHENQNPLEKAGADLGVALQIQADIKEMWGSSEAPSPEVMNKKKLIPVIYALEKSSISEKRKMGEIYFKRVLEPDDVTKLRDVIESLGAKEDCEKLAESHFSKGIKGLSDAGLLSSGNEEVTSHVSKMVGYDPQ